MASLNIMTTSHSDSTQRFISHIGELDAEGGSHRSLLITRQKEKEDN
jgi:hypothetical protein